ncbi:MAG: phenylphosphate carboxylase subunit beta [Chloroflexi bacterium]|nr:phenylphosphate carboxylase subunit beta [Chloroflexota bacterium]
MIEDLRDFIAKCEEIGELARVSTEVDWDLELCTVADLNDEKKGPALLFEKVRDSKFPVLIGALSSARRCALALDMPMSLSRGQMAREWMERVSKTRIPPRVVSDGPVLENVIEEEDVDLFRLPIPRFYPLDGGRYVGTNAALVTQDPETGWTNLGTYRMGVHDSRRVGIYTQRGKHSYAMALKYREMGKNMPAAIVVGQLPLLFLLSSTGVPWGISEYDYAGAVRGEPVEVVRTDLSGLLVPAAAEWVIEGEINPDPSTFLPEGPFGEYPGYYSVTAADEFPKPVFDVKRILHRDNAIFWCQTVGNLGAGKNVIPSIQISASIWSELTTMRIPGIMGVFCPPESGARFMVVVSVKQQYPGHTSQVAHAVAATLVGNYRIKIIVVVDDDIPADDIEQVLWAIANRSNPERSVQIFRRTTSEVLDPGLDFEEREIGSRLFIDATIPYEWKRKPIMVNLDTEMVQKVKDQWDKYGIGASESTLSRVTA